MLETKSLAVGSWVSYHTGNGAPPSVYLSQHKWQLPTKRIMAESFTLTVCSSLIGVAEYTYDLFNAYMIRTRLRHDRRSNIVTLTSLQPKSRTSLEGDGQLTVSQEHSCRSAFVWKLKSGDCLALSIIVVMAGPACHLWRIQGRRLFSDQEPSDMYGSSIYHPAQSEQTCANAITTGSPLWA